MATIVIDEDGYVRHDSPHHDGGQSSQTAWASLAAGKTIGKVVPVRYVGSTVVSSDIVQIQAEDKDAMEIALLFTAPKIAPDNGVANVADFGGPWQTIQQVNAMTAAQILAVYGANGPFLGDVKATIEWGVGGVQNTAVVDMVNGAGVHLNASFVRVKGTISQGASDLIYQIGAQFGPGSSKFLGAQYTEPLGSLDANVESAVFPLPAFARRVTLAGMNVTATPGPLFVGSIRFWRNHGLSGPTQNMGEFLFSAVSGTPVPIPNGAYFYSVVSQYAAPNRTFAIFDLAI